ncbi:MAG: hypothetical protein DMF93_04960 [Acidobacteria bacterium]|nr:MAG: hypothetical protein DMF93_04960 [Acidobacteriota bacterium]
MEMRTIDLRAAAVAEAERIAAARSILRSGDEAAREWLSVRRPWIASVRAGRRSALRGRAVMIWQVAAEDSCGAVAAAAIVAAVVELADEESPRTSRRTRAKDAVARIERCPPTPIADLLQEKTDRIVAAARAFAEARLVRAREVAACAPHRPDDGRFQPGLFDGRAERARRIAVTAGAAREDAANARVAAAAAAADIRPARSALLLVLTA